MLTCSAGSHLSLGSDEVRLYLQVTVRESIQMFISDMFYKLFSTFSVQVRWFWCPCPLTALQKAGAPPWPMTKSSQPRLPSLSRMSTTALFGTTTLAEGQTVTPSSSRSVWILPLCFTPSVSHPMSSAPSALHRWLCPKAHFHGRKLNEKGKWCIIKKSSV